MLQAVIVGYVCYRLMTLSREYCGRRGVGELRVFGFTAGEQASEAADARERHARFEDASCGGGALLFSLASSGASISVRFFKSQRPIQTPCICSLKHLTGRADLRSR